jgi:hypothetical protein
MLHRLINIWAGYAHQTLLPPSVKVLVINGRGRRRGGASFVCSQGMTRESEVILSEFLNQRRRSDRHQLKMKAAEQL